VPFHTRRKIGGTDLEPAAALCQEMADSEPALVHAQKNMADFGQIICVITGAQGRENFSAARPSTLTACRGPRAFTPSVLRKRTSFEDNR